ncbi:junctional protein associated with coronary artery disease [Choloepus didactylus]|uniref:junctional protein associated with coronary artery disease n=1 Tax=Choloepus didactylus TaxID=27675 RepID=UPI00189CF2EA|nr:junctional protein associated with coronary artery disease [Choloepus didactylus]XP_037693888.1 junctional protein associated with coronary artery disease [Choloepus didactylus]XP_037693889.1 junctional protein associated with coronary artery disease [Choloepus didactylus]
MYSVEDLLISHGYKVSRTLPAAREDNYEEHQRAVARTRASQGVLNGFENDPAALAQVKKSLGQGYVGASQSHRGTPRGHREPLSSSASRTSDTGFYDQALCMWPSQPQAGDDRASWGRRGPEPGGWLGPEARGGAHAHGLPVHLREGPWEVGTRTESAIKAAILEEELRMSGPARWQNVSLESWNQPRKLGRQMSDSDGERVFQDLYPFIQGEHVLNSQNKGKSQSLPRVLSPESLSCVEVPIPLDDGRLPGVPKMPFYPPNCAPTLESTRNPEKAGSFVPLPQRKFGRPLKPPSYESHWQSRGGVENSDYQDSQQTDLYVSYLTKTNDPRHDLWASDPALEPPVYVPPPSYRSPPEHITNPYLEDAVPRQQQPMEKTGAGHQLPCGSLGTGNEYGAGLRSPPGPHPQPHPTTAYDDSSVEYIPFDHPRIRHIKLAQPQGICKGAKPYGQLCDPGSVAPQELAAHRSVQHDGAFWDAQSRMPMAGSKGAPAAPDPSPPWLLGHRPRDGESDNSCIVREPQAATKGSRLGHPEGHVSSPRLQGERTRETMTKLKTFETGSQIKRCSKKKMNETIFCLVSIPVKSESHLPDIDTNNDLKQSSDKQNGFDKKAALQEQSLLSMSSTDLELQALMGCMAGKAEPQKHDLGEPEDKETNDFRFIHPTGPGKSKPPGSWPGHLHRDQQTQTSFAEEPTSSQPLPGPTSKCWDPPASEAQKSPAFAPGDPNQRPSAHHLKGQLHLSLSSNSAFSWTPSSTNRAQACSRQPCPEVHGHAADPTPKGEVVKGEAAGPCNSKQLFGQFLLKPVSRRPWDLISQLESFNKELQEEEESSSRSSGSEESETEWQQENGTSSRPENSGLGENSQEMRVEQGPRTVVPEEPGFRSGRVKSKSESWSEEQRPGWPCAWPRAPGPLGAEGSRGGYCGSAAGSLIMEKRVQEVESRIDQLAVSPGPVKRMMAFRLSDTKPAPPVLAVEPGLPLENQKLTSVFNSVELSQMIPPRVDAGGEQGTGAPLSLADKGRGLSAPDLRAVGLSTGQEQCPGEPDGSLEKVGAVEIPQNESLQARAARILGIDVAVETLLRGSRRSRRDQPQPPASEDAALRTDAPGEKPLPGPACPEEPAAPRDAFYGRRKCGWTESPLFVGGRDGESRAPPAPDPAGLPGAPAEPPPRPPDPRAPAPDAGGPGPPFRATLFHFVEGSPSAAGPEKRPRGPSKAIESLQEKLASPPRRAAPERLLRMKEVSSVSRMRLLASPGGAGATPEPKDAPARSGEDPARRGGRAGSASRGALSREESGRRSRHRGRRSVDEDSWCPDSYDPSRVERV